MAETKIMSQKDRSELRRILKARFQLLHQGINHRRNELNTKLREEVEAEYADAVKDATKRSQRILTAARKLQDEANALEVEMAEKGVEPGSSGWGRHPLFTFSFTNKWTPKNINEKVQRAYAILEEQAGLHTLDLSRTQLELEEEIAIGALGSDEAREFLAKIPNIDNLLPLNGNVAKALAQPIDEDDDDPTIEGSSS